MEALTLDRAKELAREVVEEFGPDYRYPEEHRQWNAGTRMCLYVRDGQPSCFVAQILVRHGVPVTAFGQHEFKGAHVVTTALVPGTPLETLGFLENLQQLQDEDNTWGYSLNRVLT